VAARIQLQVVVAVVLTMVVHLAVHLVLLAQQAEVILRLMVLQVGRAQVQETITVATAVDQAVQDNIEIVVLKTYQTELVGQFLVQSAAVVLAAVVVKAGAAVVVLLGQFILPSNRKEKK
jgi:hypothetical protein